MYRGHALAVGIKGLLKQPGMGVLQPFVIEAEGLGQVQQRPLSGVADDFPRAVGVKAGVVAQRRGVDQLPDVYKRQEIVPAPYEGPGAG